MKRAKLLPILSAISLVFCSLSSVAKPVSGTEYKAVVDTAYNYFNGAANGDQEMLASAFDMEFGHVKMIRVDKQTGKENIRSVPLNEFAKIFKKATKDEWQANVLSVDIVDDKMAMVKLNFDTPKTNYVDYLVMYKRNDEWKIINKTFVANKKG